MITLQGGCEKYPSFIRSVSAAAPSHCVTGPRSERASGPCRSSGPHHRRFPVNAGCGLSCKDPASRPSLAGMRPPRLGAPGSAFPSSPLPPTSPLRWQTRGPLLPAGARSATLPRAPAAVVPAVNGVGYRDADGAWYKRRSELSEAARASLLQYEMLQYNLLFDDEENRLADFFTLPEQNGGST